jgi:hypothetical protein
MQENVDLNNTVFTYGRINLSICTVHSLYFCFALLSLPWPVGRVQMVRPRKDLSWCYSKNLVTATE